MNPRPSVYISNTYDPFFNVGLEEHLINICAPDEIILYLWQNRQTVFIGKHQNPYKECNVNNLRRDGINLVRRKSGGGAVFHDMGNLNFTFVAGNSHYNVDRQFAVIVEALKPWGIDAVQTGRNDLTVDGKKFSGNAFIKKKNVACHHGTILLDVNMAELGTYLTPPPIKLISKGVDSVRSRVINLKELNGELTIDALKSSLVEAFSKVYEQRAELRDLPPAGDFAYISDSFKTWDWVMAKSPKAEMSFSMKFSWGNIIMDLSVKKGLIEEAIVSCDSLVDQPFEEFAHRLVSTALRSDAMVPLIDELFDEALVCSDMKTFVAEFVHAV